MKYLKILWFPFWAILFVDGGLAISASSSPTINLDQSVHFMTPSGDDVVVEAGTYEVEAVEEWLRLIPQGRDRVHAILLQAETIQLDVLLNTTKAESQQVGTDQHLLALLLPDGRMLEAEGSYSGVRSKGRLFRNTLTKRRPSRSGAQLPRRPVPITRPNFQKPLPSTPKAKAAVPQRIIPQPRTSSELPKHLVGDFLTYHNVARANVSPAATTPLPSLTWNQEMANVAQGWAN